MEAKCEISESGDRIDVTFPYDPQAVLAVKRVPGARFIPKDQGGPKWMLPLDITSARMLREGFGEGLQLGSQIKEWGRDAVAKEEHLTRLAAADDASLPRLKKVLPKLAKFYRPYQRADVAFLAKADAINSNQPGLGKTSEAIGAIFESGTDEGSHLVIAPKTSLDLTWRTELERWQKYPVFVVSGDSSKERREEVFEKALEMHNNEEPFWLVINPDMVRMRRDKEAEMIKEDGHLTYPLAPVYPELYEIEWAHLIVDEYHKMGLTNTRSLLMRSVKDLPREHTILMSGTPMGGKPIKLFPALQMIDPGRFTSKWRWAGEWLYIEEGWEGHKKIEGIRKGLEQKFFEAHAPYLLRRKKEEVIKELPPKQRQIIMCPMTPKQGEQYAQMAAEAEIRIEEESMGVTGVLAEYTRLKQFAGARQTIKHMADETLQLIPTEESGKLPYLMELLAERGISKGEEEGDEKVVIFSQFSKIVDMIVGYLESQGIPAAKITGNVNRKGERERLVDEFQSENGPRVIVMTTGAGGVSITLDRASTVVFWDETWDPDDQEQAEDRVHRVSRIHQVMVYYLRTRYSIEEYIAEVTSGKRLTNDQILDLHRKLYGHAKV